jgi:hypothetical protein
MIRLRENSFSVMVRMTSCARCSLEEIFVDDSDRFIPATEVYPLGDDGSPVLAPSVISSTSFQLSLAL